MNYLYKISFVCLLFLATVLNVFSQNTVSFFQEVLTSDSNDAVSSVIQVNDGGYVIAGSTDGFGLGNKSESFILKTDEDGNLLWAKTYGDLQYEYIDHISATEGGGVIISGYTNSFGGNMGFLSKLDRDGNQEWVKTFANSSFRIIRALQRSNGRYIVAGNNGKNLVLMEVSSTGDTLWTKQHHASYNFPTFSDKSVDLIQLSDGYVLMGTMLGLGNQDAFYVLRTDLQGNVIWEKSYGSANDDVPYALVSTYDNGLLLGGSTGNGTFWSDMLFVRTDSIGDTLWTKSFDFATSDRDIITNLYALEDSTYLFLATTEIGGAFLFDILLGNIDDKGNLLWVKEFGDSLNDYAYGLTTGMDNEIIIAGYTDNFNSDDQGIYLIKTFPWDTSCNIIDITDSIKIVSPLINIEILDTTENRLPINIASETFQVNDVTASLMGYTVCSDTFIDSSDIGTYIDAISNNSILAYPNPTAGEFYVDLSNLNSSGNLNLELFDLMGRLVYKEQVFSTQNKLDIDLSAFNRGTYLLKIYSDKTFAQVKIVKQ